LAKVIAVGSEFWEFPQDSNDIRQRLMTRICPPFTFVIQDRHATIAIALDPDRNIHGVGSVLTVLKILLAGRIVHTGNLRRLVDFARAQNQFFIWRIKCHLNHAECSKKASAQG
jgi:hypothetical protein